MKWITATHLKNWALRRDSQSTLPYLVRRLIRATTQAINSISFPSGDSVAIGGWDGILEVYEETEYLPGGISLWEFGTNSDVKGKADDDYDKRKKGPLGFDPKEVTYIFVTPRTWSKKDEWIKARSAENHWKEIRVYDADDLEGWLDTAPSVAAWLATKYLNIYPSDGIQATDDFWEEWSTGPKINMPKDLLLGGRKEALAAVLERSQMPGIIPIQASSREEATAFILSTFLSSEQRSEDFFSRSIVVDSSEAFRALMVLDKPMYLIVRFEDDSIINRAVAKGHTILVPLGIEAPGNWDHKISLPTLDREAFIQSLINSGLPEKHAEELSKQSARNIAVFRRQLEFKRGNSPWAEPSAARELIPALLAGRWNENIPGDKAMIELLAGEPYDSYIAKLKKWTFSADPPIVQIGNSWRLTSPLDAWTQIARTLNKNDFELFGKAFLNVMSTVHPRFELPPEERHRAAWHGKKDSNSRWLREGLAQSMILIAEYGEKLKLDLPANANVWVNHYIYTLLDNPDPNLWKSLDTEIPLIAESAPAVYIDLLQKYLDKDPSPVTNLFEEEHSFFDAHSYHTGMLWALENLAWFPEYLSGSAVLLARLADKDPGGRLSNRPNNSLNEIFKPWHPQTLAELNRRIAALKLLTETERQTGLNLLIRLLPSPHSTAHPTHKPRWRLNDQDRQQWLYDQEINQTHAEIIGLITTFYDGSEELLVNLLEKADNLQYEERDQVLKFIGEKAAIIKHPGNLLWHQLRKELSHHRSHPTAHWALPEEVLESYQQLYDSLEPAESLEKILWLFKEHWPAFPEGLDMKKSHTEKYKGMLQKRIDALQSIYNSTGITGVLELIDKVPAEHAWILGDTAANLVSDHQEILQLSSLLTLDEAHQSVALSFVKRKMLKSGNQWGFQLFDELKEMGYTAEQLAKVLNQVTPEQQLWDFLEKTTADVQHHYWKIMQPDFYQLTPEEKQYGLQKLMEQGRYYSAVNQAVHFAADLEAEFIVSLLQSTLQNKSTERHFPGNYEIESLMVELDKKGYENTSVLVQLEWGYLPILRSYGDSGAPRLEAELARSPDFFIQVMDLIYQPEIGEANFEDVDFEEVVPAAAVFQEGATEHQAEKKSIAPSAVMLEHEVSETISSAAEPDGELESIEGDEPVANWHAEMGYQAYSLLSKWKTIPGMDKEGNIDEAKLNAWIDEVREKAKQKSLLESADGYIGALLASYPEDGEHWPPEAIASVIQRIATKSIKNDFHAGVYNKRGSSSRSPTAGGHRERQIAKYFGKLTTGNAAKFPVLASILDDLRLVYEAEAKEEDLSAEKRRLDN